MVRSLEGHPRPSGKVDDEAHLPESGRSGGERRPEWGRCHLAVSAAPPSKKSSIHSSRPTSIPRNKPSGGSPLHRPGRTAEGPAPWPAWQTLLVAGLGGIMHDEQRRIIAHLSSILYVSPF